MTPAIQTEIRVQSKAEAQELSYNLTLVFKKMTPFPEKMERPPLIAALDLGVSKWHLGLLSGQKSKVKAIQGADKATAACEAIRLEMRRLGVTDTRDVVVCHEIGRDGLWVADRLASEGFACVILSSDVLCDGSRKPKTDRLDAMQLAVRLARFFDGSLEADRVHLPPPPEVLERREVSRRRADAVEERIRYTNKFKAILARHGEVPGKLDCGKADVESLSSALQLPLAASEADELRSLQRHIALAEADIADADRKMHDTAAAVLEAQAAGKPVTRLDTMLVKLMGLKGVGPGLAWVLVHELYHRRFANVRQAGAATGLVAVPRASGSTSRCAGISRRSNSRLRGDLVELAWLWRRHQPGSALTGWFTKRTAEGVSARRMKKVAIVAMARKLAVALWKYLEHDMLPEGALVKKKVVIRNPRGAKAAEAKEAPAVA